MNHAFAPRRLGSAESLKADRVVANQQSVEDLHPHITRFSALIISYYSPESLVFPAQEHNNVGLQTPCCIQKLGEADKI